MGRPVAVIIVRIIESVLGAKEQARYRKNGSQDNQR